MNPQEYAKQKLHNKTLSLYPVNGTRNDWLILQNVTGEMVARFPCKEAFDAWVDIQHSSFLGKTELEELFKRILDSYLLSGSGFDGRLSYDFSRTCGWIYFDYHFLNNNGYYDGWGDFKTRFYIGLNPLDFRIYGMGQQTHYLSRKHDIRGYLDDTFAYAIQENLPKWWGKIVWPDEQEQAA